MSRRPYPNFGPIPNSSNERPVFTNSNWSNNLSPTMKKGSQTNNGFTFNPQANPFQNSYPPTANYFNLTSISKSRTESINNIQRPLQRLNSESKSSSNDFLKLQHTKKHKKELTKLDELKDQYERTMDDINHYERKKCRLLEDQKKIVNEIESVDRNLKNHKNKLNSIQIDIDRENRRIEIQNQQDFQKQQEIHRQQQQLNQESSHQNSSEKTNQHSPSACSMNKLSLNGSQVNVQSTLNTVMHSLLNKKKDVEFQRYDHIFEVIEEILEPKPLDANSIVGKIELPIQIKKLISKDESEKCGLRYILRGCIYDSTSLDQSDNLTYIKSYEFQVPDKKKLSWDNSEVSAYKQVFPFDFTNYSRLVDAREKKLTIICNLNSKAIKDKKIALGVYMVKRLDFKQTLELVQKQEIVKVKRSEITKNQVTNLFEQSCGLQMDSYKNSLVDPISKAKMTWPCIDASCEHISTFDGLTFLESNAFKFPWYCPICGKTIGYDQLFYDELIKEILKKVSVDCTAIAFDKQSNWMPLSEETAKKEELEESDDCITLE